MNISEMMETIGKQARAAARDLAVASPVAKAGALTAAADAIWAERSVILAANAKDLDYGDQKGLSPAMMDRLMLDEARIQGIVDGLRAVAAQADPVAVASLDTEPARAREAPAVAGHTESGDESRTPRDARALRSGDPAQPD